MRIAGLHPAGSLEKHAKNAFLIAIEEKANPASFEGASRRNPYMPICACLPYFLKFLKIFPKFIEKPKIELGIMEPSRVPARIFSQFPPIRGVEFHLQT